MQKEKCCESESKNEKSVVVLDIKPIGVETDLCALKKKIVESIKMEGLCWG